MRQGTLVNRTNGGSLEITFTVVNLRNTNKYKQKTGIAYSYL